jgi:non-specific serine/threonine protein kinase
MIGAEISLTPGGSLRWEDDDSVEDWREALFALAARKSGAAASPTLSYWREVGRRYLSALCHVPEGAEILRLELPSEPEREALVLAAPPMRGGEYLDGEVLQGIWDALHLWVEEQVEREGLETFLRRRAPNWRQVGRVFFHLAENKKDQARPFAFMATYTTGLSSDGKLKHLPLGKSLQQYAGAGNRQALIRLLSPVQRAGESLPWVQEMIDSSKIYQAQAWTPAQAYRLLRSVAELEESGLSVLLPNWWKRRPRPRVSVTIGEQKGGGLGASALLDFEVTVALGEEELSPAELAQLLAGGEGLVQLKGQWVEVDGARLQQALEQWKAVRGRADKGEIGFLEGMRLLAGASADLSSDADDEQERQWAHVQAGEQLGELLRKLRHPEQLEPSSHEGLQATLRPYQETGVAWMRLLSGMGLGACLADDMGLGKTIQVLALLLAQRQGRSLLVVPSSLLGNWRREGARFAPDLRMLLAHPAEAGKGVLERLAREPETALAEVDLVVTTYSMLSRQSWIQEVRWRNLILDEAQAIKNPSTSQARAVKKLKSEARIALTGTPVENRLGDLWSLFDFLNPGLLGSAAVFKTFIKGLQARPQNQFAPLRQLVGPYILRRKKTDRNIISELPDKIESPSYCGLTRAQVKLYDRTVKEMAEALGGSEAMARRGLVLQTLMRLKQICNHPSQLTGDGDFDPSQSGKFARLTEICQELHERQEKALVFTQFREIVDPLADHLATIFGRPGLVLHGGTMVKQRQGLVDAFQDEDGPPFFVLSLKAGGTGLTLTQASHVIHFDRWWNPAVENQATDRAFRIGQKRNVLVHKLITQGTLEERIDRIIAQKQQLADDILEGESEVNLTELSDDELLALVRLDVSQASIGLG